MSATTTLPWPRGATVLGRSTLPVVRAIVIAITLALCICDAAGAACPKPTKSARSVGTTDAAKANLALANKSPVNVRIYWVDEEGMEQERGEIEPGKQWPQVTHVGHVFRARSAVNNVLMLEYAVTAGGGNAVVEVQGCDRMNIKSKKDQGQQRGHGLDTSRWAEIERLVHDQSAPCVGPSSNWSCVRSVSPEELEARDKTKYGFHEGEALHGYKLGQTTDTVHIRQQQYVVNCTEYSGGYLKMSMTDAMKKALYPWYEQRKKDAIRRHETIPGGFTNNHLVPMDKISLDQHRNVHATIVTEMKEVLQWWTKQPLRHTMTFGLRVYRRGAMLINHMDRQDTHLASAVIQVGQEVDEGWPLEVVHPHKSGVKEVYLQPGEMVLYEGARLQHGRPMRFNGEEFGSIFSHFVPMSWKGVDGAPPNPYYKQETLLSPPNLPFGSAPRSASEL